MARRGTRAPDGGGGLAQDIRRFHSHRRQLHRILGETQRCLKEVSHMNLFPLESAIAEAVRISREGALRPACILVLGPARARLVNLILGENILPRKTTSFAPKGWRWLRFQHGPRRQIRLSLGTDFEVVEPNLSMDSNWEQIPLKDLKRSEAMDLSTVMDIELCNPFLENGVQILVPPDLGDLSLENKTAYDFTHESTIKDYEAFYAKRGSLLENVYPIIVYALEELGPIDTLNKRRSKLKIENFSNYKMTDMKSDNCDNNIMLNGSRSFLSKFKDFVIKKDDQTSEKNNCDNSPSNFYVPLRKNSVLESIGNAVRSMDKIEPIYSNFDRTKSDNHGQNETQKPIDEFSNSDCESCSGLSEENLLDLRQIYELHPNSQVLFVLFSDSVEKTENSNTELRLPPNFKMMATHNGSGSSASLENYSLNESPISLDMYVNSEFATNSELSSVSPMSDDVSGKVMAGFSPRVTKDNRGNDLKFEPRIMKTDEKLSSSVNSAESILFTMDDEDKEKLLDKQRSFLASLVEQLAQMTHSLSSHKFTGHWLIVDDSSPTSDTNKGKEFGDFNHQNKMASGNGAADTSTDGILQRDEFIYNLVTFSKACLKNYILDDCNELSEIHNALLQQFIVSSFDMAREMQIVPKKIHYVAVMEQQLYDTLNEKFTGDEKREELLGIIQKVLQEMKQSISSIEWEGRDPSYHLGEDCLKGKVSNSIFYELDDRPNGNGLSQSPDITSNGLQTNRQRPDLLDNITDEYLKQYYVVESPVRETAFSNGVDEDNDVELGSPVSENSQFDVSPRLGVNFNVKIQSANVFNVKVDFDCCKASQMTFKQASLEIQRAILARLSRNISLQLVDFVDCLRDSYFGTLQRCLESLEEGRDRRTASEAVRRILLVTRSVNLQHCASFSFLHALIDHIRRFFHRLSLSAQTGRSCCAASPHWRKQVALDTIDSLSAPKLARIISMQLRDRMRLSHEQFQGALQALSDHHAARLQQTEDLKLSVRKLHAPRFARLCLESTSLRDLVCHGLPHLGKEIGRGQYGVVYAVKGPWAAAEPCAVKSVVPPDDRHFNELAMEFFHTRNIPPHERIVSLRGSVIDHSYGGGGPAVLLVSQRLKWDLHCALLNADMNFKQRMQVAVDIVEGIRYLHSQGLVHRDIKLKNVLLEEDHRAKLTDLGFCIPEAMMSGSIVGTPVHMAPELLSGLYDSSVDVYAFGILFWYVCAGSVKLPCAFEHFQNKEQLWCNVRKGLRPERLPCFMDASWSLMEKCWSAEPAYRPLLGDVQPVLEDLRDNPEAHQTNSQMTAK